MIKSIRTFWPAYVLSTLTLLFATNAAIAQTPPNLGTAATYGAFSGNGAIGNTGLTVVNGDIGTYVGSFTGFPPGQYTGAKHVADAAALSAKNDLTLAYNSLNDATHAVIFDTALSATMGNGQVLTPRTYGRGDLTTLSGTLTFDAKGNPAAVFIIKIRAALNVAKNTTIVLANGAQAANIYWAVDGAVSILDNSIIKGTILSNGAIHLYGGSTLEGRALAVVGAVTFASNVITKPGVPPSNRLVVITPATGDSIKGGTQNYQITWGGTGIASMKTFEYSLDSGATWKTIDTLTTDLYTHSWNVPDTMSNKALVRITDKNGLRGVSGLFTITSSKGPASIVVVRPARGEMITGGTQNYQITWTGSGIASRKTFSYSLDSGATWTTIGVLNSDAFSYSWNVPDTASTKAIVRIVDNNGLTGQSGVFTILSGKTPIIVVTRPSAGEGIAGGTQNYQIQWTGTKIATKKTFELSLDNGMTWSTIGVLRSDGFSYGWNVPDTTSTMAMIRITDSNGLTGRSGVFIIFSTKTPIIVVTRPSAGESIVGGTQNYQIQWTGTKIATKKTFELSLDNGVTWSTIGVLRSDGFSYGWNVPDTSSTMAMIRITDSNGLTGRSGVFTITSPNPTGSINSLTLSGLTNNNIGNGQSLGINYTYTPDIGPNVTFEYLLDNAHQWTTITTKPVAEGTSTSWMTPLLGSYPAVLIRVTSTKGMTRTSAPFSIGIQQSVSNDARTLGYSLSNYPNPASGETTISFAMPTSGDATIIVSDPAGRELMTIANGNLSAGTHTVRFNATNLSSGVYTYRLVVGGTVLIGRMNIVK